MCARARKRGSTAPIFQPCPSFIEEPLMPLINLVITLVVVGLLLWLINSYIPMQATIKKILNVVVVIAVVLWLLSAFGVIGSMSNMHVG